MEELFQLVGEEVPPLAAQNARDVRPEELAQIRRVGERLSELQKQKAELAGQKKELEEKCVQFEHFSTLDMPFDERCV